MEIYGQYYKIQNIKHQVIYWTADFIVGDLKWYQENYVEPGVFSML